MMRVEDAYQCVKQERLLEGFRKNCIEQAGIKFGPAMTEGFIAATSMLSLASNANYH